jgi:hypothetical protein
VGLGRGSAKAVNASHSSLCVRASSCLQASEQYEADWQVEHGVAPAVSQTQHLGAMRSQNGVDVLQHNVSARLPQPDSRSRDRHTSTTKIRSFNVSINVTLSFDSRRSTERKFKPSLNFADLCCGVEESRRSMMGVEAVEIVGRS